MKRYLSLLMITISLVANSQNNLTINGKFLNFKEFENQNYYQVSCEVYNPVSSLTKHQFGMFDKNGEFEFNYHIEYPTILEFNSQHRKYSLAVKPGDAIKFTINLSDTTVNVFHGKSFTNSNLIIDSLLFEIKERYSRDEITSLNPQQMKKVLNGYNDEQKYFILSYLAFKMAETVSIKNEKLRFIEFYKIISPDSVVFKYNNELNDLLTKQYADFVSNLRKPDNSIVFIDKQFDTFTNMIEYIKSRHKGKIIFIDVWYTACGGCIFDLKKKKEFGMQKFFDNHNVQSVFIDLRSPEKSFTYYVNKLDMKGEHHRFMNKFRKEEYEKYSIIGFPHYFLINKNGDFVKLKNMRPWVKTDDVFGVNNELLDAIEIIDKE